MTGRGNNPPSGLRFIGSGDSDEFFDLVLLDGDNLIILVTQEPAVRDAIRERLERGEPIARLKSEYAERLFSYDEIPIARIRRLEWTEGSHCFLVEYEVSPRGRLTDAGCFLDASSVPRLVAALEQAGRPVDEVRDAVVTALSLIAFIAPPVSLFVGVLAWSNGLSLPSVIGIVAVTFVAVAALLWRANRKPSVGHVATFR